MHPEGYGLGLAIVQRLAKTGSATITKMTGIVLVC
jgi:signal transduction histidine kinase